MSYPVTLKMLAIDDEAQSLEMIQSALGRQGVEILTSTNPEAGFDLFLSVRPRIVLLTWSCRKFPEWSYSSASQRSIQEPRLS